MVCLGQAPPGPKPDFSPQRVYVVLGVTAKALRFIPCTEQKSDPQGPEILHAAAFSPFHGRLSVLEVLR